MAVDLASLKPGAKVTCAVAKLPRTADQQATLARLMRKDPANAKALKRAQRLRRQRVIVYNRGNRDWTKREKTARVVKVAIGAKWTMSYSLDQAADLRNVEKLIDVKASK